MIVTNHDVLLVVDVQNDFCSGGALAVPDGEDVVPVINPLMELFTQCVLTQDWHPQSHSSFASTHQGKTAFETIDLSYGAQVLWPDHCIHGTPGAAFHMELNTGCAQMIVRKGFRTTIDSYSAFFENDRTTPTGLTGYLKTRNVNRVFLCGLATDFCVAYSAIDACTEGFGAYVLEDACRAIDLDDSLAAARTQMKQAGVHLVTTSDIEL